MRHLLMLVKQIATLYNFMKYTLAQGTVSNVDGLLNFLGFRFGSFWVGMAMHPFRRVLDHL